jgi:2'-5' RNA ligase
MKAHQAAGALSPQAAMSIRMHSDVKLFAKIGPSHLKLAPHGPHTAKVRLSAMFCPPESARRHLAEALRTAALAEGRIDWLETTEWSLRLAAFGHVSHADGLLVRERLLAEMHALPAARVRLGSVVPLPEDGDDSVWVNVVEQVNSVTAVAEAIPGWVRPSGFLLDRRWFRPRIRLGRVTARTTVADLERLIESLDGYRGPSWVADRVLLVRDTLGADGGTWTTGDVLAELRLAVPAPAAESRLA